MLPATSSSNRQTQECGPGDPPIALDGEWLSMLAEELERPDGVRYRVVAAALRAAIAGGRVPVGARLPPQRELASRLGVARTTIVEAFNLLRAESLVRSQKGAGTWVIRRPEPPAE